MRFNNRQAALLGIPDLPQGAFEHVGDRRIRPQGGGGIPIVSDVVDFVGDVVGGVVDGVVDIITDIPLIGEFADDQLGLDPNGGGMVPVIKGVATAAVLAPVGGFVGGALNTGLGLGLGTAGTAALGGATIGAATGGVKGAVYGAAGGYLGSVISETISGGTTTQIFDDGSSLTYNTSTGMPISGMDISGNSFSVGGDGIARYADGSTLGGIPEQNFGSDLSVSEYVPPPPQPPEWVQQGFTSELEAQNFTNEDIFRLENQGVARQDISEFARKGFTADDVRMFANKGMSIQDVAAYADQFSPEAVRQLQRMDYTLDDIAMLQGMGLNNDQIVNLANNAVNEQNIAYYANQGYNPDAVIDALLANDGQASMNALIAAGPEASYAVAVPPPASVAPPADVFPDLPPLTEPPGTPVDTGAPVYEPTLLEPPVVETPVVPEPPVSIDNLPPLTEPPGTPPDLNAPVYEPSLPEPPIEGAPVVDITSTTGQPGTIPYDENALGPLNPNAGDLQVTLPGGMGDVNIPPELAIPGAVIVGNEIVDALTPEMPTSTSPYAGQSFTPMNPDDRWSGNLINANMVPAYVGRAAQVPFYQTTSPVQSQYYWGVKPYVPLGGDMTQYNQVPEAPAVPFGIRQAFFEQPTTGPVAPVIYGPNMTPISQG